MTFTYDVVLTPADDWHNADTFTVVCSCGIASGVPHASIAAAHREPLHTRHLRPTGGIVTGRYATFSGEIVYEDGLPVAPVDIVGVDR